MPESGPVYQPTTVSFEARPSAGGLLAQTTAVSSMKMLRKPAIQMSILVFGLIMFATGIALVASGSADYSDAEQHPEINPEGKVQEEQIDVGLIVTGAIITLFGIIFLGLYVKVADWRRSCVCPCVLSKKQGLARQLQGNGGGQILALNPSTDPLVSHTQYAPVSEIPTRQEDEERRNLMPDSKDSCMSSAEESDRMLDTDPRIVLRPIGSTLEDA
ncbi:uncharacterized protein LOC125770301 [Anopheles funestus]|uniref:Uncharacterized protein n=1 Tax=Anopheles funestus TaxID=62324 RepID=A0A182R275_ANOFN|nr:uncharacterized protein LOC125770301 [Anopheles funestus]XP_049295674.1 uncharacterized protein LOC125770301 [Anopheles funestus]XP_049295684.1 uncharacterized protein LOC125770301 [Anopheles funestus]XP_049295691.1 uncharacterized protein LOC125770301 [Anopheles funestus]XP_049295697.1 uncharacterized protein LOC125770301 [Anopheles funestus]